MRAALPILALLAIAGCSSPPLGGTRAAAPPAPGGTLPSSWLNEATGDVGDGWPRGTESRVRRAMDYVARTGRSVVLRDDAGKELARLSVDRSAPEDPRCAAVSVRRVEGNSADRVEACRMPGGETWVRRPPE